MTTNKNTVLKKAIHKIKREQGRYRRKISLLNVQTFDYRLMMEDVGEPIRKFESFSEVDRLLNNSCRR